MRIAYVINDLGLGGAQSQLAAMAHAFTETGHEVKVISMLHLDDPGHTMTRRWDGLEVSSLGMRAGRPDPRAILRLRRLLTGLRPDIVHSFMAEANILTRLARTRAPLISSAHSIIEGSTTKENLLRITDPLTTANTQVSSAGLAEYRRRRLTWARPTAHVPNGVALPDGQTAGGPRDWLYMGRFAAEKRIGFMLDCYAGLQALEPRPERTLTIAGAGPEASLIVRAAAADPSIRFVGQVDDGERLLMSAGALLLASSYEGFPNLLLEGLAWGLSFTACLVGDVPVLLNPSSRGVDPHCTVGDFAQGMREVEVLREKSPDAAMRDSVATAALFEFDRVMDHWEELYGAVIHGTPIRSYVIPDRG